MYKTKSAKTKVQRKQIMTRSIMNEVNNHAAV